MLRFLTHEVEVYSLMNSCIFRRVRIPKKSTYKFEKAKEIKPHEHLFHLKDFKMIKNIEFDIVSTIRTKVTTVGTTRMDLLSICKKPRSYILIYNY